VCRNLAMFTFYTRSFHRITVTSFLARGKSTRRYPLDKMSGSRSRKMELTTPITSRSRDPAVAACFANIFHRKVDRKTVAYLPLTDFIQIFCDTRRILVRKSKYAWLEPITTKFSSLLSVKHAQTHD